MALLLSARAQAEEPEKPAPSLRGAEFFVSAAAIAPSNSDYRSAAYLLGYDAHKNRFSWEAEAGVLRPVAWGGRFAIGGLLRADIGRLGAPYDGVEPIRTDALFLAVRQELVLVGWPRIFLYADEGFGLARFGVSGSHRLVATPAVRGGFGLRIGNQPTAARLRIGYAWAPTLANVSAEGGKYDFGGWIFSLDGVLRVLE